MDKQAFDQLLASMQGNKEGMLVATAEEAGTLNTRMDALIQKLLHTPNGPKLAEFLIDNQVKLRWSRDPVNAQHFYQDIPNEGTWGVVPGSRCIMINPDIDDTSLISAILHEARHAQQAIAETLHPMNDVSPFESAWLNRFIEADAQSEAILKTLKMKVAGDGAAYEAAKRFGYESMFAAAEEGYAQDPTSLNDGRLKRMIFDAWFTPISKAVYDGGIAQNEFPRRMELMKLLPGHGLQRVALNLQDIEKIGVCGGETINYMTLPGFKPLTDIYYLGGFTEKNLAALDGLKKAWEQTPSAPAPKTNTPSMNM